ncbi:SLAM family member 9-like isoform 5-T6 [Morphnus guianensis]
MASPGRLRGPWGAVRGFLKEAQGCSACSSWLPTGRRHKPPPNPVRVTSLKGDGSGGGSVVGSCHLPAAWPHSQPPSCRAPPPGPGFRDSGKGLQTWGVFGEQLPGEEDFHSGVWVQTQREDGVGAYKGVPLPLLHHAKYGAWAQHGPLEVVGAVHGVAYLSPRLQTQTSYHQIHWRRNNSVKIASRDSRGKVWYANSTYKGRLELFPNNTLKISCLQKNDSSMYQVYLEDEVGKEHIENILLTVYELVPKPTVNAKVIRGDSTWCKATLECSVGLEGVAYEWIPPSKLLLEDAGASEQHVSFDPLIETYTCKVSNPVSSNNASLTYRHPCSWTGESSAAAACTTTSMLVVLGHLLPLFFLLSLA